MLIGFKQCTVDEDVIEVVARFTAKLSELTKSVNKSNYEQESISQIIISAIAEKIAKEYIAANKMEITNAINLKEITDAIQIKIVEGFSLNKG